MRRICNMLRQMERTSKDTKVKICSYVGMCSYTHTHIHDATWDRFKANNFLRLFIQYYREKFSSLRVYERKQEGSLTIIRARS